MIRPAALPKPYRLPYFFWAVANCPQFGYKNPAIDKLANTRRLRAIASCRIAWVTGFARSVLVWVNYAI